MRAVVIRIMDVIAWIAFVTIIILSTARGFMFHGFSGAVVGFGAGVILAALTAGTFIVLVGIYENTREARAAGPQTGP